MALTPDYENRVVHSDASITDMVEFHQQLRELEASDIGLLYPIVHTYKELPLGGAIFPAVAFVNDWTLQFPAGNFSIKGGNLSAVINPVAGCYIDRTQSAAYAVSSAIGGSTGPTAEDIASTTLSTLLASQVFKDMISSSVGEVTGPTADEMAAATLNTLVASQTFIDLLNSTGGGVVSTPTTEEVADATLAAFLADATFRETLVNAVWSYKR